MGAGRFWNGVASGVGVWVLAERWFEGDEDVEMSKLHLPRRTVTTGGRGRILGGPSRSRRQRKERGGSETRVHKHRPLGWLEALGTPGRPPAIQDEWTLPRAWAAPDGGGWWPPGGPLPRKARRGRSPRDPPAERTRPGDRDCAG